MNAKRKEAALKAIAPMQQDGCSIEEIKAALEASDKKYTAEEVEEILSAANQPTEEPGRVTFDKLLVRDRNITAERGENPEKPANEWWELSVIGNKRKNVKITQRNADELNAQAHNTLIFYGQSGKVKVADTIIIKIPRNQPFQVVDIIRNED